jgi:hypothetical protein
MKMVPVALPANSVSRRGLSTNCSKKSVDLFENKFTADLIKSLANSIVALLSTEYPVEPKTDEDVVKDSGDFVKQSGVRK